MARGMVSEQAAGVRTDSTTSANPTFDPIQEREARALFAGNAPMLTSIVERFAGPRVPPIRLRRTARATQGHAYGTDLDRWLGLFEAFEMETADPGETELMPPAWGTGLLGLIEPSGPARTASALGFFSACSVIVQQDGMSYLASWASTAGQASKVYYFHPHDWGLWPTDGSITARLFRVVQEEDRPAFVDVCYSGTEAERLQEALTVFEAATQHDPLPPHLDPAALFPRSNWLVHALLGVGRAWSVDLTAAAPLSRFDEERQFIPSWPHLAAYWLWSHYLLGNRDDLETVLEMTKAMPSPVVVESRSVIGELSDGQRVKLGERDRRGFEKLQTELQDLAPPTALTRAAQRRAARRRDHRSRQKQAERSARKSLQKLAGQEPLVEEALLLLDHLRQGGAAPPPEAPVHGGLAVDAAMDRLAELMDPRFRNLVLTLLERSMKEADTHRDAGWGLILAWSELAENLDEFDDVLDHFGRASLGPRRQKELFRAYGRFDDPRATRLLAQGAQAWLLEVDDWIRMAPSEPLLQLIKRDTLETHAIIAQLLEKATFSPANWDECVAAAVAAGELGSRRAVPGLRRAVVAHLGRVDDGGRAKVVRALVAADPDPLPFLRERFFALRAAWRAAAGEDLLEPQRDLACLMAGLLPLAPSDPEIRSTAKTLLARLRRSLVPRRTPRLDTLAAATAVIEGIRDGQVQGLKSSVQSFTDFEFKETTSTAPLGRRLRALAGSVATEL